MIIWLASYPKSGNTWVRSFISSILFSKDGKANFDDMDKIKQFPSRRYFKNLVKNFQDIKEIKKNWITAQDIINLDNKIKFFKTHHMNCKIENDGFTNEDNTFGVIYIVRDPRNVITSIMHHYHKSTYQEAKKFLFEEYNWLGFTNNELETKLESEIPKTKLESKIPTPIGSWKTHYRSWIKTKKNFLLIKYENLITDPNKEFGKITNYLESAMNLKINSEKIQKSIQSCSFKNLSDLEIKSDFSESVIDRKTGKKKKFFNLGPNNDWKKLLDENIRLEIEEKFNIEMKELGYL